jgi:predicted KAP-like P-loop ATPase
METDKPISKLTDDKLNRKTFVKALAVEIENIKDSDCSVVGLYGKWGSGKTSIIKLLDEELKTKYFFTSYFNPWRYKSEEIMLKELFLKILEGAQSDKKLESRIQELGKLFDDYSQYISVPKVSFWGIAFDFTNPARGLGKRIGKLLKGNDSFDNKKKKINEVLTNLALPLIIFIDDVDRLDVVEIHSLFKLIKLTADFNNLIYVIAFDDEMVSKALAKNYGIGDVADGKGFLEKIVQLPLRIPFINDQERFDYTLNLLNVWLNTSGINLPDKYQPDFVRKFNGLHDNFIKTPRDSKRLINSVSFSYQCLKSEICIYDIILLETIRIFAPLVFDELISFKQQLFSNPSGQNGYTLHNDLRETGKAFKEKISSYQDALPSLQGAIDFMFPSNNIFNVGWETYRSEKQEDLFKYQRVGVQKYFDRFIEFKISKLDISDTEFKGILEIINTKEYSLALPEIKRLTEFPKQAIFSLFIHFKEQLTDLGKINVSIVLCTMEHYFKDTTIEGRMFHRPTRLSLQLLEKIPTDKKVATLKFIFEKCERINHVAFLILDCQRGYGKEKEFKFEPENEIENVAKDFITKVQSLPIENLFENVDDEKNDLMFNFIEKYGDINKLKAGLVDFIKLKAENGLLVMKSLIQMSYYNFSQVGEYGDEIGHDRFKAIEYYVPREVLQSISYELFPDLEDNIPENYLRGQKMSKDKLIIVQYLRFIENDEQQKQLPQ